MRNSSAHQISVSVSKKDISPEENQISPQQSPTLQNDAKTPGPKEKTIQKKSHQEFISLCNKIMDVLITKDSKYVNQNRFDRQNIPIFLELLREDYIEFLDNQIFKKQNTQEHLEEIKLKRKGDSRFQLFKKASEESNHENIEQSESQKIEKMLAQKLFIAFQNLIEVLGFNSKTTQKITKDIDISVEKLLPFFEIYDEIKKSQHGQQKRTNKQLELRAQNCERSLINKILSFKSNQQGKKKKKQKGKLMYLGELNSDQITKLRSLELKLKEKQAKENKGQPTESDLKIQDIKSTNKEPLTRSERQKIRNKNLGVIKSYQKNVSNQKYCEKIMKFFDQADIQKGQRVTLNQEAADHDFKKV